MQSLQHQCWDALLTFPNRNFDSKQKKSKFIIDISGGGNGILHLIVPHKPSLLKQISETTECAPGIDYRHH